MELLIGGLCVAVGAKVFLNFSAHLYNAGRSLFHRGSLQKYGPGSWALVTACTDGIGKGFVVELARHGFNIVAVGRNPEKLEALARELLMLYGVETRIIVKDFADCPRDPQQFFTDVHIQAQGLDVSVLINNVGAASNKYFLELSVEEILQQNALNLWSVVCLSKLFMPDMERRDKPSLVVNLASTGAIVALPRFSIYTAGKTFVDHFSRILSQELQVTASDKVQVLSLMPGWVQTPMSSQVPNRPLEISPEECARAALKAAGSVSYTNGHWKHFVWASFFKLFKNWLPFMSN